MWAQSLDNIYLLIKFGHRHDAPGCLEIKNKEIYINKNILTFKAYCIQVSNTRIIGRCSYEIRLKIRYV